MNGIVAFSSAGFWWCCDGGVDLRASPEQKEGLNRRKRGLTNVFPVSCSHVFPRLILWRAAECTQTYWIEGFGLAAMKGSHLCVNGSFGWKRSPVSAFVSAMTCSCPVLERHGFVYICVWVRFWPLPLIHRLQQSCSMEDPSLRLCLFTLNTSTAS